MSFKSSGLLSSTGVPLTWIGRGGWMDKDQLSTGHGGFEHCFQGSQIDCKCKCEYILLCFLFSISKKARPHSHLVPVLHHILAQTAPRVATALQEDTADRFKSNAQIQQKIYPHPPPPPHPPTLCRSSITYLPEGLRSEMKGMRSEVRWKSSRVSSSPQVLAMAIRCSTARSAGGWVGG